MIFRFNDIENAAVKHRIAYRPVLFVSFRQMDTTNYLKMDLVMRIIWLAASDKKLIGPKFESVINEGKSTA